MSGVRRCALADKKRPPWQVAGRMMAAERGRRLVGPAPEHAPVLKYAGLYILLGFRQLEERVGIQFEHLAAEHEGKHGAATAAPATYPRHARRSSCGCSDRIPDPEEDRP